MVVFLLILILLAVLALTEFGRAIIIAAGVAIRAVAGAALVVAEWTFNVALLALLAGGFVGYLAYALAHSETTGWVCGIAGFAIGAVFLTKVLIAETFGEKVKPPQPPQLPQARRSGAFSYGYRSASWIADRFGGKLKQPSK